MPTATLATALALSVAGALALAAALWPEPDRSFSFVPAVMATQFRAAEDDAGVPARESVAGSVGYQPGNLVQESR